MVRVVGAGYACPHVQPHHPCLSRLAAPSASTMPSRTSASSTSSPGPAGAGLPGGGGGLLPYRTVGDALLGSVTIRTDPAGRGDVSGLVRSHVEY